MPARPFLLLLCCLLLASPGRSFAQTAPDWPRNPETGRVEFVGTIPWPTPTPTLQQQQTLVRRWFLRKLTVSPGARARRPAEATFAGLPNHAYLDSTGYQPGPSSGGVPTREEVTWRLRYAVQLTATPAGLAYRLSEFEIAEVVFDASTSDQLEAQLPHYPTQLAGFHRRLRNALAGW
ncbi:hypothetical protein [Hymenobacter jeollabukensis]|uniref:DUF4136 domain-containing protein n=1 Tax=Hymenobacter jeollabukensis TaxID=2025313 RepID=A0A5R8WTX4_9BACT|nr:hypothetical protein [Hymenobacter jeollabukensis]TLM94247.1 hypothetical protein FDY95_09545 [Hymenobacter jeollabukensis]